MTTSRTHEVKIEGPSGRVELGELRWLVQQLKDAPDNLPIRVSVDQTGHQLDPGMTRISANVPDGVGHTPNPSTIMYPPGARGVDEL